MCVLSDGFVNPAMLDAERLDGLAQQDPQDLGRSQLAQLSLVSTYLSMAVSTAAKQYIDSGHAAGQYERPQDHHVQHPVARLLSGCFFRYLFLNGKFHGYVG